MREPAPWRTLGPLDSGAMWSLRRSMALDGFKWDPRVGDVETLCPAALVLKPEAWGEIAGLAESLFAETLLVEWALLDDPGAIRRLALPRRIARLLAERGRGTGAALADGPRVMRFDFHWTGRPDAGGPGRTGWAVSEVNSDVPGGYIEASSFTGEIAGLLDPEGSCSSPGPGPTRALIDSVSRCAGPRARVALVHATAYCDDAQVMHHLARAMAEAGHRPVLCAPDAVPWGKIDALQRFFPAEWIASLPRRCGWERFFVGDELPQTNPGSALLCQSKLWMAEPLRGLALPTWRSLAPPTTRVKRWAAPQRGWAYKPALGRVGEGVVIPGVSGAALERKLRRSIWRYGAGRWVRQQLFEPVGLCGDASESAPGPVCLGVYVIDGRACGIYGRIATGSIVDSSAQDIAVLVDPPGLAQAAAAKPGSAVASGSVT